MTSADGSEKRKQSDIERADVVTHRCVGRQAHEAHAHHAPILIEHRSPRKSHPSVRNGHHVSGCVGDGDVLAGEVEQVRGRYHARVILSDLGELRVAYFEQRPILG